MCLLSLLYQNFQNSHTHFRAFIPPPPKRKTWNFDFYRNDTVLHSFKFIDTAEKILRFIKLQSIVGYTNLIVSYTNSWIDRMIYLVPAKFLVVLRSRSFTNVWIIRFFLLLLVYLAVPKAVLMQGRYYRQQKFANFFLCESSRQVGSTSRRPPGDAVAGG